MFWAAVGAAALLLGVVAGAFGAHGLAPRLDARSLQTFETAVRYHLIHGLGLLAVGTLVARDLGSPASLAGALMTAGHRRCSRGASTGWPSAGRRGSVR